MKELAKTQLNPIHCSKGDTIQLRYDNQTVLEKTIDKEYTFTKGIIFEIEELDAFFGGNVGLGGAFIEVKHK